MGPPHFRNLFRRSRQAKGPPQSFYGISSRHRCTYIDPQTSLPCPNARAIDPKTKTSTGWFCPCHVPGSKCSPAGEACPFHGAPLPATRYQCVYALSSGYQCPNWRDADDNNQGWLCAQHKCPHGSCLNTRGDCPAHGHITPDIIKHDEKPGDDGKKAPVVASRIDPIPSKRHCSRHEYCTEPDCGAKVHTRPVKSTPEPARGPKREGNGTADPRVDRPPPPCRASDCWEPPTRWPDVWMCKKHMALFDPDEPIGFADRPQEVPPPPYSAKEGSRASQGERLRIWESFTG
ncbi:hypothetical protein ACHAQA_006629 [Verticillium albo-atrum]